ncbi:hypothetical protein TIFTF001_044633 [Ficus carica]|uniref:Uncharacterized protein n=1 Tax=Ficus carica TaxID=3494 RepID=A0AA88A046_FICCA|nr:hypothetical protein TIFTF001_044633 [Ficus carica]
MVHGLSWIGWLPKLLHVKLCVSWFELKWTAAFNHSLAMYHVVLAERKLTSYVYAVVYVCMASKLPLVVPIHIKSGLVYNLIMMAFKEGLKVRHSRKYLSVTTRRGKSGRYTLLPPISAATPPSNHFLKIHPPPPTTPHAPTPMELIDLKCHKMRRIMHNVPCVMACK